MKSIVRVELPQNAYDVTIAPGSLDRLGDWMRSRDLKQKVLVISNPEIFQLYGDRTLSSLEAAGFETDKHLIPAGEQHKTLESVQQIYDTAIANHLERSSTAIALGGGVIGDMTGFFAATFLRGINFVQVPTSLLAMVDASVGGKTGVNHPKGKNTIGAFYQPRFVLIDPEVLATLPPEEFRAGMAEVVKYGIIWDADLFDRLENADKLATLGDLDAELLMEILTRSVEAKAAVVSKDEKEAGLRAILNYGHTIGHALESLTDYKEFLHGEAVAVGMVAAGAIASQLQWWDDSCQTRQVQLLDRIQLPTRIPATLATDTIIDRLQTDKKVKDGKVRFILPTAIGSVEVTDAVSRDAIAAAIGECR